MYISAWYKPLRSSHWTRNCRLNQRNILHAPMSQRSICARFFLSLSIRFFFFFSRRRVQITKRIFYLPNVMPPHDELQNYAEVRWTWRAHRAAMPIAMPLFYYHFLMNTSNRRIVERRSLLFIRWLFSISSLLYVLLDYFDIVIDGGSRLMGNHWVSRAPHIHRRQQSISIITRSNSISSIFLGQRAVFGCCCCFYSNKKLILHRSYRYFYSF